MKQGDVRLFMDARTRVMQQMDRDLRDAEAKARAAGVFKAFSLALKYEVARSRRFTDPPLKPREVLSIVLAAELTE